MNFSKIAELFISGKSNSEIAQIMIDADLEGNFDNTRKSLGFIRKYLKNGQSAEALLLVKQKKDGKGNVVSETFARRSLQDETIPENLELDRLTTAPGGGQWRKYKSTMTRRLS